MSDEEWRGRKGKYFHSGLIYDHRGTMEANLGGITAIETPSTLLSSVSMSV